MKKTLIVLCSAIALVGCDQNRGGMSSDKNRDTGFGSSRDSTYSSRSAVRDTNTSSLNSPAPSTSILTNTNGATPLPDNDGTQPKN